MHQNPTAWQAGYAADLAGQPSMPAALVAGCPGQHRALNFAWRPTRFTEILYSGVLRRPCRHDLQGGRTRFQLRRQAFHVHVRALNRLCGLNISSISCRSS